MHSTSISLLEELQRPGAQVAWERFVRLYTPLIYYWARRAELEQEDAADLTQDVFAVLVEKLPGFQYNRDGSFRAWLKAVTLNRWRDLLKRRSPRPLADNAAPLANLASPGPPDDFEETEYRKALLRRAMQLVERDFQPATWRAFWEVSIAGRPAADVAAELGMTAGAVYAARFRVVARLRQDLAGLLD